MAHPLIWAVGQSNPSHQPGMASKLKVRLPASLADPETVSADPEVQRTFAGLCLGLGVLKALNLHRWADLGGVIPADVLLRPDQLAAIRFAEPLLGLVQRRRSSKTDPLPAISVLVCPDCGRWTLHTGGAKPKCQQTDGCYGMPAKPVESALIATDGTPLVVPSRQ